MKYFIQGFAQPFENWLWVHRLFLGMVLAACTFGLSRCWMTQQLPNPAIMQATLTELAQQVRDAQKKIAELPTLERQAQALKTQHPAETHLLDEAHLFRHFENSLSTSKLQLDHFEPQDLLTQSNEKERVLHLRSRGSFKNMAHFIQHLHHQNLCAAPLDAHISLQQDTLLLDLKLRVTNAQKPPAAFMLQTKTPFSTSIPPSSSTPLVYDPFNSHTINSYAEQTQPTQRPLKLLGIFTHHTPNGPQQAAWIQASPLSRLVHVGDSVFKETIQHIDAHSISLFSDQGKRVLTFLEKPQ